MLTTEEFDEWCHQNNLSAVQKKTIEIIRNSEPARRVGGGRKNVSGFYPSQKMGRSIQFESHKLELALIYQLELDWDILEFYDQPPSIKLQYQSPSGRNIGFLYTPDFFVLRRTSAGWIECKTETELKKKVEKQPHHYSLREDGQWQMPLATEYAVQLGMDFCVWSDAQINWVLSSRTKENETVLSCATQGRAIAKLRQAIALDLASSGLNNEKFWGKFSNISNNLLLDNQPNERPKIQKAKALH